METRTKGTEVEDQVVANITYGAEVINLEDMVLREGIVIAMSIVEVLEELAKGNGLAVVVTYRVLVWC